MIITLCLHKSGEEKEKDKRNATHLQTTKGTQGERNPRLEKKKSFMKYHKAFSFKSQTDVLSGL